MTKFSVELNGRIYLLTDQVLVPPLATERRGDVDDQESGFELMWPEDFPRRQPVVSYLQTPEVEYEAYPVHWKTEGLSHLDEIMSSLAYGHGRRAKPPDGVQPRWQIRHFTYLLRPAYKDGTVH